MSAFLDDVSRIIASPISRRQTLRLVCGAVGGTLLASLGLGGAAGPAQALVTCPKGQTACGSHCCPHSQTCCGNGKCCTPDKVCCGGLCCKAGPSPSTPCTGSSKCS